jgi:hypothetical protein
MSIGRFATFNWWGTEYWRNRSVIPTFAATNTVWFALDTQMGIARMVNSADVGSHEIDFISRCLTGDEAILVVTESALSELQGQHPNVLTYGAIEYCVVDIAISAFAQTSGILICAGQKPLFLNGAPDLGLDSIERVTDPVAIAALFADT